MSDDWKGKFERLAHAISEVGEDMGIYPMAVKGYNDECDYEQRTGYMNGWNAAIMEYGLAVQRIGAEARKGLTGDMAVLLASNFAELNSKGGLTINMNDVWGWACADCEDVTAEQIPEVARLFRQYGWCGILYWASEQNNHGTSEFHDNNRFIEFVRREEQQVKDVPDYNKRAYAKLTYKIGAP